MEDNSIIVQKIKKCYVGEDCIQIMVPYKENCTIFNPSEIQFSYHKENAFINKYVDDNRRKQFPYHSIPNHHHNRKITLVNQIYEFNKLYLEFRFGNIFESYAVKDGEDALLLTKLLKAKEPKKFLATREATEKLLNDKKSNSSKHYVVRSDGKIFTDVVLLSERELVDKVLRGITVGDYFSSVDLDDENIYLKIINVNFKGLHDEYEIELYDVQVHNYSNDEIKYLSTNIIEAKEPKIKTRFNKAIAREEIEQQKRLVLDNNNNRKK